jgi:cytosine/uracil/thiamine/allantoin permease
MTGTSRSARRRTIGQIFGIPLLIALLSAVGLVSALVGDGIWDSISWITLLIPILLCVFFLLKPKR